MFLTLLKKQNINSNTFEKCTTSYNFDGDGSTKMLNLEVLNVLFLISSKYLKIYHYQRFHTLCVGNMALIHVFAQTHFFFIKGLFLLAFHSC